MSYVFVISDCPQNAATGTHPRKVMRLGKCISGFNLWLLILGIASLNFRSVKRTKTSRSITLVGPQWKMCYKNVLKKSPTKKIIQ